MNGKSIKPPNPAGALRGFLFLDGLVRLFLWCSSLALAVAFFTAMDAWPERSLIGADLPTAWSWSVKLAYLVLVFNLIFLGHLIVLRALIPAPKEHYLSFQDNEGLPPGLIRSALIATLVKARYEPPFPGFLVFHIGNLPPLCWLMKHTLGPKSRSCFVLDPPITDPAHTEIGRNVTIGGQTSIIAHTHNRDGISVKKTIIEDDVMIGAHALVYGGCTIKRGAVVFGGSVVRPNTTIGENEAWGGVPAKKIKDLPPLPWN